MTTKEETKEPAVAVAPDVVIPEKETLEVQKDVLEHVPREEEIERAHGENVDVSAWTPKTELGRKVKSGVLRDIDQVLDSGEPILEAAITDVLLPNMESDLLMIGQSKGKFGGGKRRAFRATQKKTPEGNKPSFGAVVVMGNKDGYVGVGYGKSRDTLPAKEKAVRDAKTNVFRVKRGCGSWQCGCRTPHSLPFEVAGRCGSVRIRLMPAPKGKGLVVEKNCQRILQLAGFRDVWSKTSGQTRQTLNLVKAVVSALRKLSTTKVRPEAIEQLGMKTGRTGTHEVKRE